MPYIVVAIGISVIILGIEWMLWRLFRKHIEGLVLPRSSDSSALHFFTIHRMAVCAFLHTIVLLVFCNLVLFFLW